MLRLSYRGWRALTLGWTTVIAFLTLLPADQLPPTPHWRLLSFDTAAHAGVFLALALPLRLWWSGIGRPYASVGTFAVSLAYGALIEWLQITMAVGRDGEWSDLISDGIGAVVGVLLAGLWQRWRSS